MPKVDWITWKTDSKEIINSNIVIEQISEKIQDYNVYTHSVIYEELRHELEKGGLRKEVLSLNGSSPANEKALKILDNLDDIKNLTERMKEKIKESLEEQKQIEKEQLIQAIESKIEEENKIKENTVLLNERLQSQNQYLKKEEVEDIIENTNDRIHQLEKRLEIAKSL